MTFSGCQKLYEINIPSNIIKIDEFAFERCEFLRDVKLNEGLKSIGKGAFCNCSRLKKLTIPFSVSSIGSNPFLGCVCDIECLSPHFTIKNGMLFTSDMKRVISCLLNSGEIDIPEGVEIIGGSSFNSGITSISIEGISSGEVSDFLNSNYDIMTRSGGHCAPLLHESMGTKEAGLTRFSFSHNNTKEEVDIAISAIKTLIK